MGMYSCSYLGHPPDNCSNGYCNICKSKLTQREIEHFLELGFDWVIEKKINNE